MSKNSDFFDKVYDVVARIPYGKVTTYGAIAEFCGIKSAARTVGWALNSAKHS
ncbi:MAG: MGMT family protein, partial [Ignavibacteria bacterium]